LKLVLSENELKKIRDDVEKEFPHDMALQEVHIAQKIIAKEMKESGCSYYEYIQKWKEEKLRKKD